MATSKATTTIRANYGASICLFELPRGSVRLRLGGVVTPASLLLIAAHFARLVGDVKAESGVLDFSRATVGVETDQIVIAAGVMSSTQGIPCAFLASDEQIDTCRAAAWKLATQGLLWGPFSDKEGAKGRAWVLSQASFYKRMRTLASRDAAALERDLAASSMIESLQVINRISSAR